MRYSNTARPGLLDYGGFVRKPDMLRYIENWKVNHPNFYALLFHIPRPMFRLEIGTLIREQRNYFELTFPELIDKLDSIHPTKDVISVCFRTYLYRSEWDACCPKRRDYPFYFCGVENTASYSQLGFREFPDAFELMLAYWLREAMLEGETFEVDEAVCRERGLTTEQIGNLRQAFDECRDKLLDEFLCEARRYRLIVKRYRP